MESEELSPTLIFTDVFFEDRTVRLKVIRHMHIDTKAHTAQAACVALFIFLQLALEGFRGVMEVSLVG